MSTGTTGFLEGLMSGFSTGTDFRRTRSLDARQRELEDEAVARQRRFDDAHFEGVGRTRAREDLELGRRGWAFGADTPEAAVASLRDAVGQQLVGAVDTPATPLDGKGRDLQQRAEGIRSGVGAVLTEGLPADSNLPRRGFDSGSPPPSMHRITPIDDPRDEMDRLRSTEVNAVLGRYLADPSGFDFDDPSNIGAMREAGVDPLDLMMARAPSRTGFTRSGDRNVLVDLDTGDPIREYDPIPHTDDAGSNRVTQRQLLTEALDEVDSIIATASRAATLPENRGRRDEILQEANRRARGAARRRGFGTLEALRSAAEGLNRDVGLTPRTPSIPMAERVEQLRTEGVSRDDARRIMAREGYDVGR